MVDAGDMDEGDGGEHMAGGIRPDIMILEGWPETSPPPQRPTKTYKVRADESARCEQMRADESPFL